MYHILIMLSRQQSQRPLQPPEVALFNGMNAGNEGKVCGRNIPRGSGYVAA